MAAVHSAEMMSGDDLIDLGINLRQDTYPVDGHEDMTRFQVVLGITSTHAAQPYGR